MVLRRHYNQERWCIKMQIDYYAYRSGMKKWNAGLKVFLAVGTLCMLLMAGCLPVSVIVWAAMGMLTLFVGKVPFKVYLRYLLVPLSFLITGCIVIAVQFSGSAYGEWNLSFHFFFLCVTKSSLGAAVRVFFQVLAGISTLFMLSFSTPVSELILVLQRLHLPKILMELMHLIYRYIFILFEVVGQMQAAAGARLGYQGFWKSCRTFSMICGNLFLISMKKANSYYDAMLARGYQGCLEFLTEEKPVRSLHIAGCLLYFAGIFLLTVYCKLG